MAVGGGGPLFGSGRGRGSGGGSSSSRTLVEFRAGKMTMKGTLVTPDRRRGLVQVEQGTEDSLMHLKWKDRTSGVVEDDLIIFPEDAEFVRVPQCTTGRVFVLKFKNGSPPKRLFFWMQEPNTDRDEELCKKVNDYLNRPPLVPSTPSGSSDLGRILRAAGSRGGVDLSSLTSDSGIQSLLGNMISQGQLTQLFGAAASEAAPPENTPPPPDDAAAPPSRSSGVQLTDLQSVLSGIKVPAGETSKPPSVDLSAGITGDVIRPLLTDPDFLSKMQKLLPAEEKQQPESESVDSTIKSPQFKQALSMFSSGLQSGQLAPLVREFGLGDEAVAAASAGNLEAFVKAIEEEEGKKKRANSSDEKGSDADDGKKKLDDDDEMGGLD